MAEFESVREVRVGLVLYGGVSLAVYINGVVQELFSLVRATTPKLDPANPDEPLDELLHPDGELRDAEPVYRQLGRVYGEPVSPASTDGPVRTRFVIDIISGSSAGGINGIYLAKALANQQDIAGLRTLWVERAGVAELLNDRKSRKTRRDRLPDKEPPDALFSGDIMYLELLEALDAMDRPSPGEGPEDAPPSPYVRDLDVWVTATDLEGTPRPLGLSDKTILENTHRHTFHFVFGEEQADGQRRNDFAADMNPILAFAARATSAFPFAFVPARLADIARVQRTQAATKARGVPKDDRWAPWFTNQRQAEGFDYENVSFGDGGDMDNKPFGWVIDTLPSRTSTAPVDRRLLYVEPDPGDPTTLSATAAPRPDVIGSAVAAVSLGRVENIRDDIERLAKVSAVRERIGAVTAAVDERFDRNVASRPREVAAWLRESPEKMVERGLSYAAYFCLRVDNLITEFARSLVGLPWHGAETTEAAAMRALVAHWVDQTYADPYAARPRDQKTTKHFLSQFDIAFRIRRLSFVAAQADRLQRSVDNGVATMQAIGLEPAAAEDWHRRFRAEARRIKSVLGSGERWLRLWVPAARSNPLTKPTAFVLTSAEVRAFSDSPTTWAERVWAARGAEFTKAADDISDLVAAVFAEAIKRTRSAVIGPDDDGPEQLARDQINHYLDRFGDFDQATFPLHATAGFTGELDPVRVHRISPRDATDLVDPATRPKVAGARLGHFGGFLDSRWRSNDIMWGRLDTAERLVKCLLPAGPEATALLLEAQDAILQTEWYAEGQGGAPRLSDPRATEASEHARRWRIDRFCDDFKPPPWPPTANLMDIAARASQVTSSVLEGVADRPGGKVAHRLAASVAWVLTAVTTVAFPGGLARTPLRYLSVMTAGIGAALAVLGTLLNWDAASTTGRSLIAAGLLGLILILLVRLGSRNALRAIAWILIAAIAALAVYGGWHLWVEVRPDT